MTDRTAPTRPRGPRRSRRARPLLAAGSVGAGVLALGLIASACSGAGPAMAAGPAGTSAAPSPTLVGTLDTDPADPPQLQSSAIPGSPVPTTYRAVPAAQAQNLAIPWSSTAWLSHVHAVAGSKAKSDDWQDQDYIYSSWQWSSAQVPELEADLVTDLPSGMPKPTCSAQDFSPANAAALTQITNVLLLCVQTGLSGDATTAAAAWLRAQIGPELAEIKGVRTQSRHAVSATPTFGSVTYYLYAEYVTGSGYLISLQVW